MTYASVDEIIASSPNISVVAAGSEADVERWAAEAQIVIDQHCRQNFDFEQQVTKTFRYGSYPRVFLPKVISGHYAVYGNLPGLDPELIDNDDEIDVEPGTYWLQYEGRNRASASFNPQTFTLAVTADWGYATSITDLAELFANELKSLYNTHIAETDFHEVADSNPVATADATSLATALTLLNALKAAFNIHTVSSVYHVAAGTALVTSPDATDETSAVVLGTELKTRFNDHVGSTTQHLVEDEAVLTFSVNNPILPPEIKHTFIKVVQRIAIRDNEEDLRFHNSGFERESFSDGYSYSSANPALRALIMPLDEALLNEHVNEGQLGY